MSRAKRHEFPKSVRLEAFTRCGGRCEGEIADGCLGKLGPGNHHFDHYPVPAAVGGPGTIENCRVLCVPCHEYVTRKIDVPAMAKTKRIHKKLAGEGRPKQKVGGGLARRYKRKVDGTVVPR